MKTECFEAEMKDLYTLLAFVLEEAKLFTEAEDTLYHIELTAEEALTNVLKHGYQGKRGPLELTCGQEGTSFVFKLTDEAPAFNPLEHLRYNPQKEEVGSLGIFLLQRLTDRLEYFRQKDKNVLTLYKNLV